MLRLVDVSLSLGEDPKYCLIKNLNLHVQEEEFVVIVGNNGAGKSTLLNCISGLLLPDSGLIFIDGKNVTNWPLNLRAGLVSKVMQDPKVGTIGNMTVFENMSFACMRGKNRTLEPFSTPTRKAFFAEKLRSLNMGLEDKLDLEVSHLSGGQRQALSLVMATLADSKILLLDEVTAALDPRSAATVMRLAVSITKGKTVIMVTHNMAHAIECYDRLLVFKDGKIFSEYGHSNRPTQGELLASFA